MRVITIYSDRFILAINTHLYNRVIRLLNLIMSVDLEHHKRYMGVKIIFVQITPLPLGLWVTLHYVTLLQAWDINAFYQINSLCVISKSSGVYVFIQGRCLQQNCEIIVWQCRIYMNIHHWLNEHCLILFGANPVFCWQTGALAKSMVII